MVNVELKKVCERYITLQKEKAQIKTMRCLSYDLKEQCEKWYNHEINAIMANEYIYDKIKGLETGGII